jgi:circadian clock protein KaiB
MTALANVRGALLEHPSQHFELEIIDVVRDPERCIRDGVLVTPMLVKVEPLPERRLLGNLRNHAMLLGALGLPGAVDD